MFSSEGDVKAGLIPEPRDGAHTIAIALGEHNRQFGKIAIASEVPITPESLEALHAFARAASRTLAAHETLAPPQISDSRIIARLSRAEALERVVRILRDTQSVEEVLLVFVIAVSHELPIDGSVYSIEEGALVRRSSRTRVPNDPAPAEKFPLEPIAHFLEIDEPTEGFELPKEARAAFFGNHGGIMVPLRVEGALWGALMISVDEADGSPHSLQARDDELDDLSFCRTLGSHLELALANAHAFERELTRAQERATLAEAARTILSYTTLHPLAEVMCRLAATLVHADTACAVRVEGDRLKTLGSYGEGVEELMDLLVAKRTKDEEQNAVRNERRWIRVEEGPGHAIVPLVRRPGEPGEKETVDAYLIVGRATKDRFARDSLRLLLELGALFASALRNLELYEATTRANSMLRESSEFKDDLIAMLAHDFKGPLTVMLGYCELLLETSTDHREEIQTIFSQTRRLVHLSEDALMLAQTQADGFSLARTTLDFNRFVMESLDSILRTNDRVKLRAALGPIPVSLDPQRFRHVIDNLISNALKYSEKEIEVLVRKDDTRAILQVTDRGIGIPAGEQPTIFARFGRATNARSKGVIGSGVGLYVSRKIVEVHRGEIHVLSKENEGATFTVSLPILIQEDD